MIAHNVVTKSRIFTIGYEGVSMEKFLWKLRETGIRRIIDVRCNPISRKPGFSKTALRNKLNEAGIEYVHIPTLGIPSSLRKSLQTDADYSALFAHYESQILPNAAAPVAEAVALIEEMPTALLCFENDPQHCHRTRLASYIASQNQAVEGPLHIR